MYKLVEEKLNEIKEICRKYDVETLYLFGSAGTNQFKDDSDIDFLISFKKEKGVSIEKYTDNYFDLHYKLEELFNRNIDLLTENSLSNPYFIASIEETKKLLYAA